jgi:hypothetical protein
MYNDMFIHSPIEAQHSCCKVLANIYKTTIDIHVLTYVLNSFEQISRNVIAGVCNKSIFSFTRNCQHFLKNGCNILLSLHNEWEFLLLHYFLSLSCCHCFWKLMDFRYSNKCGVKKSFAVSYTLLFNLFLFIYA